MGLLKLMFGNYSKREIKRIIPLRDQVLALESKYASYSDEKLSNMTYELKDRLEEGETLDDILPDAFAVCREAGFRVLGMRAFPVQILAGIILHQGRISEMRTGEGKTLMATLPAYLNALTGKGVHIVTVNDYLARRDSEWMGKVYRFLGLKVGLVIAGMNNDQKREAYAADITYGTNNEYGFDYLRDNMVIYKSQKVQREHSYAIVDEVDSILIDEARTPLIISGQGSKSTELYSITNLFVSKLKKIVVKEMDSKEENDDSYGDGDYIVDETSKTVTLTPKGVKKAEEFFHVGNLSDPDNLTISHHINQAMKAHGIMTNEIDYVIRDGQVIIVDEFTGRLMFGRRFNEGLHQAIEAKEKVKVENESKTLATITFQNYFRLYDKLSGMTGTALTEEAEFNEIYKLDCVEIPTNRPIARKDLDDLVYKTEKAKYEAVIEKIVECHTKGQPVLVGTISIEKSEELSKMLKKKGIKHEVLNAKYHEKEAEIVSQAGKKGAVTIATNMAGRGTDIKLGGNAEFMAKNEMRKLDFSEELINEATGFAETDNEEIINARKTFIELNDKHEKEIKVEAQEVKDIGGLYIIGTERHESRRIDNQLRGRAGRQGDPGTTCFYLSLEDDLMRLFGGDKIQVVMDRFKIEENVPIEAGIISSTVENAQKKLEVRNFSTRKNVLQYDDVMSRQREIIYKQRAQVLNGEDIKDYIIKMVESSIDYNVGRYAPANSIKENWDVEEIRKHYMGWILTKEDLVFDDSEIENLESEYIANFIKEKAKKIYEEREARFTSEIMRELERVILLKNVDKLWMDHIDAMEELKRGVSLRSLAQRDPVVEYRVEGSDMFDAMIDEIKENTTKMMFIIELQQQDGEPKREQVAVVTTTSSTGDGTEKKKPVRVEKKVGRNDLCPCGSGKKYKKCCGANEQ